MSNPFLIPRIPTSAEYYITPAFVEKYRCGANLIDLSNRIQVVDPRKLVKRPGFNRQILEVEDAIIKKPTAPILCSTAIFKSHHRHGDEQWWSKYVEDLRLQIEHYDSDKNHHLRVYVGNSMWGDLDKAGLLTQNADFIKMQDSSTGWNIGNMWRILAMTDTTYEYIYFYDVHYRHDLEARTEQITKDAFENTDLGISAALVKPPTSRFAFLIEHAHEPFIDISSHFYLPIMSMLPIANFLKTKIFNWYVQPQKAGISHEELTNTILLVMKQKQIFQLYDPELNRWTYMQPHYQIYQEADSAEKIMFYFMDRVKMKLWIEDEDIPWYQAGYKQFGDGFFMKRLLGQIPCDLKAGFLGNRDFHWEGEGSDNGQLFD